MSAHRYHDHPRVGDALVQAEDAANEIAHGDPAEEALVVECYTPEQYDYGLYGPAEGETFDERRGWGAVWLFTGDEIAMWDDGDRDGWLDAHGYIDGEEKHRVAPLTDEDE